MKQGDNFSKLQYFCQMICDKCSIKMFTQFIPIIAQEIYVLGTFFYIFAFDLFKKINSSTGRNSIFRI